MREAQDSKQGEKVGDQEPFILCSSAGRRIKKDQRHKQKGTAKTFFQVPTWSGQGWKAVEYSVLPVTMYDRMWVPMSQNRKKKKIKNHQVHFIKLKFSEKRTKQQATFLTEVCLPGQICLVATFSYIEKQIFFFHPLYWALLILPPMEVTQWHNGIASPLPVLSTVEISPVMSHMRLHLIFSFFFHQPHLVSCLLSSVFVAVLWALCTVHVTVRAGCVISTAASLTTSNTGVLSCPTLSVSLKILKKEVCVDSCLVCELLSLRYFWQIANVTKLSE